jgi:hypothetical protein
VSPQAQPSPADRRISVAAPLAKDCLSCTKSAVPNTVATSRTSTVSFTPTARTPWRSRPSSKTKCCQSPVRPPDCMRFSGSFCLHHAARPGKPARPDLSARCVFRAAEHGFMFYQRVGYVRCDFFFADDYIAELVEALREPEVFALQMRCARDHMHFSGPLSPKTPYGPVAVRGPGMYANPRGVLVHGQEPRVPHDRLDCPAHLPACAHVRKGLRSSGVCSPLFSPCTRAAARPPST